MRHFEDSMNAPGFGHGGRTTSPPNLYTAGLLVLQHGFGGAISVYVEDCLAVITNVHGELKSVELPVPDLEIRVPRVDERLTHAILVDVRKSEDLTA